MAEQLSPIHKFASDCNLAGAFAELVKGVPVDARNPNNDRTPLMEAVAGAQPDVDLVRLLIEKGADVNAVATQVPLRISGEQSLVREENVSDNRCEYSLNLGSLQWRKDR